MSNLSVTHGISSCMILPQQSVGSRHPSSDLKKEQISCKSCRLKKVRCSRTRPLCRACELYGCDCLYDAVPRKKGPNNEVMKQMLKRIDGLEKRLAEKENPGAAQSQPPADKRHQGEARDRNQLVENIIETWDSPPNPAISNFKAINRYDHPPSQILDAFFQNFNGNPYSFLHPSTTRSMAANQRLPPQLMNAIYANSVRYLETDETLRRSKCEELVDLARQQLDLDEPSLENIQTSLLLSLANFSIGRGKACWMQLGVAIRMSQALDLQRELPTMHEATILDREIARRTFWTCYIMDRLNVAGSRRPCSIADESIVLRMPCGEASFHDGKPIPAPYFQHFKISHEKPFESTGSMFVDIVRILGRAIHYLQQGGVKGDSHFPWHSQSRLSSIHDELKAWASRISKISLKTTSTGDQATTSTIFLSQCIYHHIFILIYRPFLPFRIADTDTETEPLQSSWQKEAIKMCLQHATYIADLETSREHHGGVKTPPYLSYCLTSAATVFIHSLHYKDESTNQSLQRLVRVFQDLIRMRDLWQCVNFQCATLRRIYICHSQLINQYTTSGTYPSSMHLADFYDRYLDLDFGTGYIPLTTLEDWTNPKYDGVDDILTLSGIIERLRNPSITQAVAGGLVTSDIEQQRVRETPDFQEMTIAQPQLTLDEYLQPSVGAPPQYSALSSLLQDPFQDSCTHTSQQFDITESELYYDMSSIQNTNNSTDMLRQLLSDLAGNNNSSFVRQEYDMNLF